MARFKIYRTSAPESSGCPVEGAYLSVFDLNYPDEVDWCIDINSLDELVALRKKVAEHLVLKEGAIEIYDDYRE